jgi:hypothetical protein
MHNGNIERQAATARGRGGTEPPTQPPQAGVVVVHTSSYWYMRQGDRDRERGGGYKLHIVCT